MALTVPPSEAGAPSTRQVLTKRQSATVDALLDAGLLALREVGFDNLSLRDVATRAGVTHTTAYNYFTSKEHLVAELNWRLQRAVPEPDPDPRRPLPERLAAALRDATELYAGEEALAEALLVSLVARDPDIERIRTAIGADFLRRIETAAGPDADPRVIEATLLIYSGSMLQAGLGYFNFTEVADQITRVMSLLEGR